MLTKKACIMLQRESSVESGQVNGYGKETLNHLAPPCTITSASTVISVLRLALSFRYFGKHCHFGTSASTVISVLRQALSLWQLHCNQVACCVSCINASIQQDGDGPAASFKNACRSNLVVSSRSGLGDHQPTIITQNHELAVGNHQ